ncbi:MAG: flavin monoamine oxidase family protein [Sulfitobacter sp.]
MTDPDFTTDVAIIGAGAAGTYCAYRLTQDTDQQVTVFEKHDRVGGRLWSHHWPEADTMVELGGEAFSPAHAIVAGLTCRELGLEIEPHNTFNTLNRLFLRNQLCHPQDMRDRRNYPLGGVTTDGVKLRYFMQEDYFVKPQGPQPAGEHSVADPFEAVSTHLLKYLSPEVGEAFGILMEAYGARVAEVAGMGPQGQQHPLSADQVGDFVTPEIYEKISKTVHALEHSTFTCSPLTAKALGSKTVPSHNLDFWSMVVNDLGQEAYALFREAGYDNTSALSFNFVELMQNLLLGALMGMAAPNFWSIKGGFDTLPKTMMRRASDKGATLKQSHALQSVQRNDTTGLIELTFGIPGGRQVVCHAKKVVMSAPVSAFDEGVALNGFDPELTQAFAHRRAGIASIAAGKLYLVYPRPWWSEMTDLTESGDPLEGYANTDMPSRAIYYKGRIGDTEKGLMTGALTDSSSSDFWSGFLSPDAAIFPGATSETRRDFAAPVHMVSACQGILQRMHRDALPGDIPEPELALYHEWRSSGGGWSAWKSGRDIHKESAFMRQPFCAGTIDEGLYCCGDSVSERHGWVENTLESAEAMLRESFGLNAAGWIPSGALL